MNDYKYVVTITCVTQEEADQVISERVNFEEDYGFYYEIGYREAEVGER